MHVVGHTASVPGSEHAALVDFSRLRADSVLQYFVGRGMPAGQISTEVVGDTQPPAEDIDPPPPAN